MPAIKFEFKQPTLADKQRVDAVRMLQALGYTFQGGEWLLTYRGGEWLAPAGAEDAATAIAHGQG